LHQRVLEFWAVPVPRGRRQCLETAPIGFEHGSLGLAILHTLETARDRLDALRCRVQKCGVPAARDQQRLAWPVCDQPRSDSWNRGLADSQTLEKFRGDQLCWAIVSQATQERTDCVAGFQRDLDDRLWLRSGTYSPERIEKGLQPVCYP